MASYGQTITNKFATGVHVSANERYEEKVAGVTIDWSTVIAPTVDGVILPSFSSTATTPISSSQQQAAGYFTAGYKYMRLGTVLCKISGGTKAGFFAPYGAGAGVLGGGTLLKTRGNMFVLNSNVYETDPGDTHCPVIESGKVFLERIVQNGTGAADTLAGPTKAELDSAFPGFLYV
jgi:hypothetical protein